MREISNLVISENFFWLVDFPFLFISGVAPDVEGLYIVLFKSSLAHHGLTNSAPPNFKRKNRQLSLYKKTPFYFYFELLKDRA